MENQELYEKVYFFQEICSIFPKKYKQTPTLPHPSRSHQYKDRIGFPNGVPDNIVNLYIKADLLYKEEGYMAYNNKRWHPKKQPSIPDDVINEIKELTQLYLIQIHLMFDKKYYLSKPKSAILSQLLINFIEFLIVCKIYS